MKITSTNNKKGAFGFGALVQKTRNLFNKAEDQLSRYFGTYGGVWYFLGIQTLFSMNGYKDQWSWGALHYRFIYNFKFVPETFLRISWRKEIYTDYKNGFVVPEDEVIADRFRKSKEFKIIKVYESRWLYLYSPWIIDSFFHWNGPTKKVVVELGSGDDEIEEHSFTYKVLRRKLLWKDYYCVKERWQDDMTQFDRDFDSWQNGYESNLNNHGRDDD